MRTIDLLAAFLGRRPAGWKIPALAATVLLGGFICSAQQPQAQPAAQAPPAATAKKSPRHRTAPAPAAPTPAEQPVPAPPQPEPPKWPVNDTPSKPAVTWDAQGLRIEANNASLHEIMNQVSADTGAKVEGLAADERIFGEYGPGNARDVLSQLLHGSSYNVLMIGDQGSGTPRQIVLSARRSGNTPPQANQAAPEDQQQDEDVPDQPEADDQEQQQQLQPPMINGRPPMPMPPQGPPDAPRTPQQVLQELQQRQQQIQDQQQQQQQQPH